MLGPPPPVLLLLWRQELPLLLWLSVLPVEQLSGQLASPPADLHEKGLSLSTRNCCEENYLREHRVKQDIKHWTRLRQPPPVLLPVLLLLVWLLLLPFEQPPHHPAILDTKRKSNIIPTKKTAHRSWMSMNLSCIYQLRHHQNS